MNKIQIRALDILKNFATICDKYQLRYSLSNGTLLGCIRHGGFIPWDDDVDIYMPREDYNKFLSVAQDELEKNFFLQTKDTDKNFPLGFAKIRDLNTNLVEAGLSSFDIKHGVWIDIFPFDNIPDQKEELKNFIKEVMKLNKKIHLNYLIYKNPHSNNVKENVKGLINFKNRVINKVFKRKLKPILDEREILCRRYENLNTKRSFMLTYNFTLDYFKKTILNNDEFDNLIEKEFENHKFKIFKNYDKILTREYGDYMTPPKRQESNHILLK